MKFEWIFKFDIELKEDFKIKIISFDFKKVKSKKIIKNIEIISNIPDINMIKIPFPILDLSFISKNIKLNKFEILQKKIKFK